MRAGVRPPSPRPINGTLEAKQAAIDRRIHRSLIDKRGCASGSCKGAKERGRDGNIVPVCKCKYKFVSSLFSLSAVACSGWTVGASIMAR